MSTVKQPDAATPEQPDTRDLDSPPTLQTVWTVQCERGCPEEGEPMTLEIDGVYCTEEEAQAACRYGSGAYVAPHEALVFGDRYMLIETRRFSVPPPSAQVSASRKKRSRP